MPPRSLNVYIHVSISQLKEQINVLTSFSVCKSCIVLYIQNDEKSCPKCGTVIHHSYPLQHISLDRTMQDIVEKIVPGLFESKIPEKIYLIIYLAVFNFFYVILLKLNNILMKLFFLNLILQNFFLILFKTYQMFK